MADDDEHFGSTVEMRIHFATLDFQQAPVSKFRQPEAPKFHPLPFQRPAVHPSIYFRILDSGTMHELVPLRPTLRASRLKGEECVERRKVSEIRLDGKKSSRY